uniref:Uncharacterized protein n=1 Tax=Peronospora matthiolae TaxID=2874970 RepID=A0AAV1T697_9STRA
MLNVAMSKVKYEEWTNKAQQTAQKGLDLTNEMIKTVFQDTQESTTEDLKCAAESVDEFAKEMVLEIKNMEPKATVVVEKATEDPVAASSDTEWEQVTEQDRTLNPVEEAPAVVVLVVDGPVVVADSVVIAPLVAAPSEGGIM